MMDPSFLDNFILVKYNGLAYPDGYFSTMHEVAAHFDKESIDPKGPYSLHTEYSYGKRKFDTERISKHPVLAANKEGVPQLWKTTEWASAFADFIIGLTDGYNAPTIIEIHPPFNDYCTLLEFAERFCIFEKKIHKLWPDTSIVIENRAGSVYHGGHFLVGKAKEIVALCKLIKAKNLHLGVVLDFPQLLTAENIDPLNFNVAKYQTAIQTISAHRDLIKGIHVWGKKKSTTGRWVAHSGNFDTYFGGENTVKEIFLTGIQYLCNDELTRFLVPEVNSTSMDLQRIMEDLRGSYGKDFG